MAYADFADEDLTGVALALPNAVAVRTLSKSWGLAGLRVGFAAGPVTVIDWLRAAGGPYSVSTPSLALAAEWLRLGGDAVADYIRRIRVERTELTQLVHRLRTRRPSRKPTSFSLGFRMPSAVWRLLAEQGIAVRRFPNVAGLADGLRIASPGNKRDFARLTQALIATRERGGGNPMTSRIAEIERKTKETEISGRLALEGGEIEIATGIGFCDHLLAGLAFHAAIGLRTVLPRRFAHRGSSFRRGLRGARWEWHRPSTRRSGRHRAIRLGVRPAG